MTGNDRLRQTGDDAGTLVHRHCCWVGGPVRPVSYGPSRPRTPVRTRCLRMMGPDELPIIPMRDEQFQNRVLIDLCDIKRRQALTDQLMQDLRTTVRTLSQYVEKVATDEPRR
jgi:hypothetical protein